MLKRVRAPPPEPGRRLRPRPDVTTRAPAERARSCRFTGCSGLRGAPTRRVQAAVRRARLRRAAPRRRRWHAATSTQNARDPTARSDDVRVGDRAARVAVADGRALDLAARGTVALRVGDSGARHVEILWILRVVLKRRAIVRCALLRAAAVHEGPPWSDVVVLRGPGCIAHADVAGDCRRRSSAGCSSRLGRLMRAASPATPRAAPPRPAQRFANSSVCAAGSPSQASMSSSVSASTSPSSRLSVTTLRRGPRHRREPHPAGMRPEHLDARHEPRVQRARRIHTLRDRAPRGLEALADGDRARPPALRLKRAIAREAARSCGDHAFHAVAKLWRRGSALLRCMETSSQEARPAPPPAAASE